MSRGARGAEAPRRLKPALLTFCVLVTACAPRAPDMSQRTGLIQLPAGTVILHRELTIPEGAHDLEMRGNPAGSTLRAAPDFHGRALIYAKNATGLRLSGFRIDGNRAVLEKPTGLPAGDVPFARYYHNNGIVLENAKDVLIRTVSFTEVASYPIIVSASAGVHIEGVHVEDCGSHAPNGRNNASGGILIEEGTRDFAIRQCAIRRVPGNAIWTHSFYHSPRNANGMIEQNDVQDVARDAIQVGHATNVTVRANTGRRIGYPVELVDIAAWAVPVALDTAGNVDRSSYVGNRFEDINGKCMDLDGFHDGVIRNNSCVSRQPPGAYPYAQFGIVFNNSSPDVAPANVLVTGNLIDGAGYGGLYLLGAHQEITHNRFLNLNRDECTDDRTRPHCDSSAGDPALLRSGIYLVAGAARPARTEDNRIEDNQVSGFGMRKWCIEAAPGVQLAANRIAGNHCVDTEPRPNPLRASPPEHD